MIIFLNNKPSSNFLPDVEHVLSSGIRVPLYHEEHGRRHPLAIYNVSCSTVLENFSKTIAELLQVIKERPFLYVNNKNWDTRLLASQKDLLYAIMEHLDDCENILSCFFPSEEIRNKDTRVKSYRNAVKEYRNFIGKVVNYLKHEQGRLRSIVFFNEKFVLPGYFIEGSTANNFLGPVEIIHPGGNTAFSFARDLRYNFVQFYAVGKHLGDAISQILDSEQDPDSPKNGVPDKRVLEIASEISQLPLVFYADEAVKSIPTVTVVQRNGSDTSINLAYPDAETKVEEVPRGMKIVVSFRGDGVTRSFRLPYGNYKKADKMQE